MNTLRTSRWALLCSLTALSSVALAQQPSGRETQSSMPASDDTHNSAAISANHMSPELNASTFVTKATEAGMTEVELGRLALRRSLNPDIRKFAQRMVDDHGKAGAELAGIARSSNLKVPTKLDAAHAEMVQAMNDKSDADFDNAYIKDMELDHQQALALFHQAASLPDNQLAQFATRTLPTLEEHKRMADELRSHTRVATSE
jgi:putative membrane protein